MKELPKALEVVKHSKININERDANGHTALVDALLSGAILSTRFLLSSAIGEKIAFDKMQRTVGTVFHAAKNVDKRLEELQVAELGRFVNKGASSLNRIIKKIEISKVSGVSWATGRSVETVPGR